MVAIAALRNGENSMLKLKYSRNYVGLTGLALIYMVSSFSVTAQTKDENKPDSFAQCACLDILSPTQVANGFWEELGVKHKFDTQLAIVSKHLNLITMNPAAMPEDRLDRLALGEGAFLTFRAQLAHVYFASLLDGDDLIASHASNRMMQITNRAFDEKEKAFEMVKQFYQKFPPSDLDIRGRHQQIANFSSQYIKDGDPEAAIALIVEEISALPANAPYMSYALLWRYIDAINASPRNAEIRKRVSEKLSGLKNLKQHWAEENYLAADDPILRGDMPSWFWRTQNIRPGESLRAGRKRQLNRLIGGLEKWLES